MQSRRDLGLIAVLCIQAAISAAASSAALAQLVSATAVALVSLINAMLTSSTAVYVAMSRETQVSPDSATAQTRIRP